MKCYPHFKDTLKRPLASTSDKLIELSYFKYFKICQLQPITIVQEAPSFADTESREIKKNIKKAF